LGESWQVTTELEGCRLPPSLRTRLKKHRKGKSKLPAVEIQPRPVLDSAVSGSGRSRVWFGTQPGLVLESAATLDDFGGSGA